MGTYRRLFSIRITHDYFDREICRTLLCRPTASGAELMRRRGMIFKRVSDNEWSVLYDTSGAGPAPDADVLLLELLITDADFALYTRWRDFCPDAAYMLDLPAGKGDVEAEDSIVESGERRKIGSGFCIIRLVLTREMLEVAQSDRPQCCILRFHAPEYRWEYLFLPEHGFAPDCSRLHLETSDGSSGYSFFAFKKVREFDRDTYRTVSEEPIPLRESYRFRLRLALSTGENRPKQMLLRDVPPPKPGRHLSAIPGFIRQVCII